MVVEAPGGREEQERGGMKPCWSGVKSPRTLSSMLQGPLCPQWWAGQGETVLTPFLKTVSSPAFSSMVTTVSRKGEEIWAPLEP